MCICNVGVQEGLRYVRGFHDALNSLVAGAIAGGAAAGYYQGWRMFSETMTFEVQ
jgi:hypothetical protein